VFVSKETIESASRKLFSQQEQKNDGRGVTCVRAICTYLDRGDFNSARTVFQGEGDKIRAYPDIEATCIKYFGCRSHGKHNCNDSLCIAMREHMHKKLFVDSLRQTADDVTKAHKQNT